jgi:hypothetical protein
VNEDGEAQGHVRDSGVVRGPVVNHSRAAMRVTVDLYSYSLANVRADGITLHIKRERRIEVSNAEHGGDVEVVGVVDGEERVTCVAQVQVIL